MPRLPNDSFNPPELGREWMISLPPQLTLVPESRAMNPMEVAG
jgi:hypothetical protein